MFERLLLAVMLGVPVAVSLVIPRLDPGAASGASLAGLERIPCCGFRHTLGIPCPLCGLTRSFVSFGHGEIKRAFMFNLLGPPMFVFFVIGSVWSLASAFRRKKTEPAGAGAQALKRQRQGGAVMAIAASLFIAAWALKLALVPREFW